LVLTLRLQILSTSGVFWSCELGFCQVDFTRHVQATPNPLHRGPAPASGHTSELRVHTQFALPPDQLRELEAADDAAAVELQAQLAEQAAARRRSGTQHSGSSIELGVLHGVDEHDGGGSSSAVGTGSLNLRTLAERGRPPPLAQLRSASVRI
jgi:hypothetical protein